MFKARLNKVGWVVVVGGVFAAVVIVVAAGGGNTDVLEPAAGSVSPATLPTTGSSQGSVVEVAPTTPGTSMIAGDSYLPELSGPQVTEAAVSSSQEPEDSDTHDVGPDVGIGEFGTGNDLAIEFGEYVGIGADVEVGESGSGAAGADSGSEDSEMVGSGAGAGPTVGAGDPAHVNPDDEVVELIESAADSIGGARSVPLEETVESEDASAKPTFPTGHPVGKTYVWHDGDRMFEARLEADLVVTHSDRVPEEAVVADTGSGRIVSRTGWSLRGELVSEPVFRSASGELMLLPGGAIVVLDEDWARARVDLFFESNGISVDSVSELDWLDNGFFVETAPGFASLDTANSLVGQSGVKLSTPNWWVEVVTK